MNCQKQIFEHKIQAEQNGHLLHYKFISTEERILLWRSN